MFFLHISTVFHGSQVETVSTFKNELEFYSLRMRMRMRMDPDCGMRIEYEPGLRNFFPESFTRFDMERFRKYTDFQTGISK